MGGFNYAYAELSEVWGNDMTNKRNKKNKKVPQQDPICDLYESKQSSNAYSETELVNYAYDKSRNQRTYKNVPERKSVDVYKDQDDYEAKPLPKSLFEKQFEVRQPQDFDVEDPKEYMVRTCKGENDYELTKRYENEEIIQKPRLRTTQEQESDFEEYLPQEKPKKPTRQEYYYTSTESDENEEPEYMPPPPRKVRQERKKRYVEPETDYESDYEEEYQMKKPRNKKKNGLAFLDILLYVLSGIILIFLLEQFVKIGINLQHV